LPSLAGGVIVPYRRLVTISPFRCSPGYVPAPEPCVVGAYSRFCPRAVPTKRVNARLRPRYAYGSVIHFSRCAARRCGRSGDMFPHDASVKIVANYMPLYFLSIFGRCLGSQNAKCSQKVYIWRCVSIQRGTAADLSATAQVTWKRFCPV